LCIWWQRGRWRQTDIMWIAPFFAMALAMSILTIAEQLGHIAVQGEAEWTLGFAERLIIASNAIWFYAGKVLCPADLAFVYPRWNVVTSSIWSWFPLAGVIIVGGVLWAWRRRSWARVGLFGFLFFVMALLPVLGFFDVFYFRYSFVADHFQYLASLGIIALAATGIAQVLERNKLWLTPTGNVLCAVLLVTLAGLTWKQARVYRDPETLWRDTVTKNPVGWMAHDNLGYTLTQAGKLDEAMEHFERALRIRPDYPEAHNNLGVALTRAGRTQEAISHFEQALRLKPHYPDAYYNLGIALADAGRLQEAVVYYERALELKPDNAEAYNNLGNALVRIGRVEDAIRHWEQSLQINPDFAEAHNNWGSALLGMGKAQEAIEHYERSLRINPDYAKAHYNLGTALELTGRTQEAINHYERAAQLNPAFAEAQDALKRVRGSQ